MCCITGVAKNQELYDETKVARETEVASYYKVRQQLDLMGVQFQEHLTNPKYIVPFLQPGRLIKVNYNWKKYT
jgi:ATP-dependent RNA helicase DOB1